MLIIFDFDGPLREFSWEGLVDAYRAIIRFRGKNPDDFFTDLESFKKFWNPDWRKNEAAFGGPLAPQEEKSSNILFHEVYDAKARLHPWVPRIIGHLSEAHTLAVLSSAARHSVERTLGDLQARFGFVGGCEDVVHLKPHPEGVQMIMKKFSASPDETIIIGDAEVDLLAGKNAGVKTGFVHWSDYCSAEVLRTHEPDYEFEKPEDLLNLNISSTLT